MASRFHTLRLSSKILTLGKQFGTGIILATAFIHMMPTAMSNLSSPCLGPVFSENYTAFGGLIILFSSLFMHWIEFIAMEHNQQRMREAAAEGGVTIENSGVDLGGLKATGVAAAPCPVHVVMVLNEAVCRKSSCSSSVSHCVLDHNTTEASRGPHHHHHLNAGDSSVARSSSTLLADVSSAPSLRSVRSYGSLPTSHQAKNASQKTRETLISSTDQHHHHYREIGHSHAHGLELLEESQRKVSTYILEAGVAAHSIIIGISLGVSSGAEFTSLLAALSFHQFFEGISSSYQPTSALAVLMEGVFDAISSGILLYMGYVNLLAVEFNQNGEIRKEGSLMKQLSFFALWAGAAVMAFLGRYAMSKEIKTMEDLNIAFDASENIIIDFYSESNEESRSMKPYFEEVAKNPDYAKITFLRVNTDELKDVKERYEIQTVPTFLALQSRELLDQCQGTDKDSLKRIVEELNRE
ncbi:high-affinity Zn(2+) transporter zrt1 [Mortierella sp. NVP85]|nr:high-affinity Zn(2+) transporter zrt1 [Mortierella sp. NVP85]